MKHPVPASPSNEIKDEDIRFVDSPFGKNREVKSKSICCVCDQNIWVVSNLGRATIMNEAFLVVDPRAYMFGTPDYLTTSNLLLKCHYTCQKNLINQLNEGTFARR